MQEVSIFLNFPNSFHPTIKFTGEMSSERAAILDTEVFKGPRLLTLKILDSQTHFKPTEYTLSFSSYHLFNTKKGFIKRRSITSFNNQLSQREQILCKRGYPTSLVCKILTEVQFSDRTEALCSKQKRRKKFNRLLALATRPHRILRRFL